jgi:hypothetical protein
MNPSSLALPMALRRVLHCAVLAWLFWWGTFHLASALVLIAMTVVGYLGSWPLHAELRLLFAQYRPRYRRRLRPTDEVVDTAFARIVAAETARDA